MTDDTKKTQLFGTDGTPPGAPAAAPLGGRGTPLRAETPVRALPATPRGARTVHVPLPRTGELNSAAPAKGPGQPQSGNAFQPPPPGTAAARPRGDHPENHDDLEDFFKNVGPMDHDHPPTPAIDVFAMSGGGGIAAPSLAPPALPPGGQAPLWGSDEAELKPPIDNGVRNFFLVMAGLFVAMCVLACLVFAVPRAWGWIRGHNPFRGGPVVTQPTPNVPPPVLPAPTPTPTVIPPTPPSGGTETPLQHCTRMAASGAPWITECSTSAASCRCWTSSRPRAPTHTRSGARWRTSPRPSGTDGATQP